MSTTPEADVRTALDDAARSALLTLDTVAVLEQGHRAVRRRRARHLAVGAAAVVALGLGLGFVGHRPGDLRPGPAATSLDSGTMLDISGADAGDVPPVRKVEVTYDAAHSTGTFVVDYGAGALSRAEVVVDPAFGAGFTVSGAGTDRAVLFMLAPSTLEARPLPMPRFFAGQWSANGVVAGTDLVAVVRSLARDDPGPQTLYGADPTRGAVFGDGSRVDAARVALGPAEVIVWLNPSHLVWGNVASVDGHPESSGSGNLTEPLDAGYLEPLGTSGTRDSAGNPVWTTIATGFLPSGATEVTPEFRAGRPRGLDFGSAVMTGEGRVALAVRCTTTAAQEQSSEDLCRELKGVSWVDRTGTKHFTPLP